MPDVSPHRDRTPGSGAGGDPSATVVVTRALAALLDARLTETVDEWESLAEEEPWGSLPAAARREGVAELARALADTALSRRGDAAALRRLLYTAATHGARRRAQGIAPELLLREFGMLREALWRVLQRAARAARVPGGGELDAIYALDLAVAHATRAALFGAYRDRLAARGAWPAVLDALGDEEQEARA